MNFTASNHSEPIKLIEPYRPLFDENDPNYSKRYLVFHGGRGSGKSQQVAMACLHRGFYRKEKILCARQFQNSIKDSVHSLLDNCIDLMGMRDHYETQRDTIIGKNGTEFIFKGLHNNIQSIKSLNGVTIAWCEESQSLSEKSWETLTPTVREKDSQFFVTYNIDLETDPTYQRFNVKPPPNAYVRKVNFDENPWFPDVLKEEMEWCRQTDVDAYMHVWMGDPRMHSEAQVFNGKWEISRFEPEEGTEFFFGSDFGFANDPTTAVQCFIRDHNLYIYRESYAHRLDIDATAERWKRDIPGIEKYHVRCDSARPETISYLQRHGIPNAIGVDKWPGSVEDGITFLRAFKKIIIHESCKNTVTEAKMYSYKRHPQTNDILPEALDKHNHCLTGDTLVDTKEGKIPIAELVGKTGYVHTLEGLKFFHNVRMTSPKEFIYRVDLEDGRHIDCTAEHILLTDKGWIPATGLSKEYRIVSINNFNGGSKWPISLFSRVKNSITEMGIIQQRALRICIGRFGKKLMAPSQKTIKSITKMETQQIMRLKTLSALAKDSIAKFIGIISSKQAPPLLNGTNQKKEKNGIGRTINKQNGNCTGELKLSAKDVERKQQSPLDGRLRIAQMLVNLGIEEKDASIQFNGNVLTVEKNLRQTNIKPQNFVLNPALCSTVRVKSVKLNKSAPVYNLEVKDVHHFSINDGLISHNCWDAVRYACGPMIQQSGGGLGYLAFMRDHVSKQKAAAIDNQKST